MYLILLKTPIEGKMQVECEALFANASGVSTDNYLIPISNIDSIIVKPE